jgi:hypothetical protein
LSASASRTDKTMIGTWLQPLTPSIDLDAADARQPEVEHHHVGMMARGEASDPAMASTGTISRYRPASIASLIVVVYHVVLVFSPPKVDPLLLPLR